MLDVGQDRAERGWVTLRLVRRHPHWRHSSLGDGAFKERVRRLGIAPLGEVGVIHLAVLINRPVDVPPRAVHAHVRLVDAPFSAD